MLIDFLLNHKPCEKFVSVNIFIRKIRFLNGFSATKLVETNKTDDIFIADDSLLES